MKILIADDKADIIESLSLILKEGGGFETDSARDGLEAVKKVKNDFYDLLMLDIMMPKLNGYEVLQQVRNIFPTMPVIFITGHGDIKKIAESISEYNLTALIEKPFIPQQVMEIVNAALKPKKVAE